MLVCERVLAPTRTERCPRHKQMPGGQLEFLPCGCGGQLLPPPLFISVGTEASEVAFYFIYLFFLCPPPHILFLSPPPRTLVSGPGNSSFRIQAGPPGHTAPLTAAPAHRALLEWLLATVASSIQRPRPAPNPPHLPCSWLGLRGHSSGGTHPQTGPARQQRFACVSSPVAPSPSRLKTGALLRA